MLSKSFYMQYLAKMCCLVSDMLNVCADLTPTPLLLSFLNSIFSIIPSLCLNRYIIVDVCLVSHTAALFGECGSLSLTSGLKSMKGSQTLRQNVPSSFILSLLLYAACTRIHFSPVQYSIKTRLAIIALTFSCVSGSSLL